MKARRLTFIFLMFHMTFVMQLCLVLPNSCSSINARQMDDKLLFASLFLLFCIVLSFCPICVKVHIFKCCLI